MNLAEEVDLEDYVARPDKINNAEIASICQVGGWVAGWVAAEARGSAVAQPKCALWRSVCAACWRCSVGAQLAGRAAEEAGAPAVRSNRHVNVRY
jgi:hypothetical protein